MVRNTLKKQYEILFNDSNILSQEDAAYRNAIAPYRLSAGLPPLPLQINQKNDFSGEWIFDEGKSRLEDAGTGNLPAKIKVIQKGNNIEIERTMLSEYADNNIIKNNLVLSGGEQEFKLPFGNTPGTIKASSSEKGDSLFITTKINFKNAGRTIEFITNEVWSLQDQGTVLSMNQTSTSFRGKRPITALFNKQLVL